MNILFVIFQLIILPLILTIIIEVGVWASAHLFTKKYHLRYIWLSILAVNLITNPALNILTSMFNSSRSIFLLEFVFEIIIISIEAMILYLIYRRNFKSLFILSFLMNLASYSIGLLIFQPFWS